MQVGALAVVIVFIAALAAPFLIPVDAYRPLLVAAIDNATGRQVQIDKLRLHLFPNVRISLVNFQLKNPTGFPSGDTLSAKSVDLGLNAHALLSRRIDVTYIAPSGVELNVLRRADGRTNFAFAPQKGQASGGSLLTLERIGRIDVKDAQVMFADAPLGNEPSFSLSGVNGTIGSIDPAQANWLEKLPITVALNGGRLTSSLLAQPLEFRTGQLEFKGDGGRGSFSAFIADVDLSGDIAFAHLNPLSIAFALKTPKLDLNTIDRLVKPSGQVAKAGARQLLAHGSVNVDKVVFATLEATNVRGNLSVYTNALQLQNASLSAYGGTASGDAFVEPPKSGMPASGTVHVRGMNVREVLAAIGPAAQGVSGSLDADLRMASLLTRDPESALTASGTFSVRDGTFPSEQLRNFSYLGGDLHIAHERGTSNSLRLLAKGVQATFHGSFGFDQTLSYAGTAIVNAPSQLNASQQFSAILAQTMQRDLGTTRAAVPFVVNGSFSNPQFKMTGTPQLVNSTSTEQNTTIPSSVQNLLKGLKI